MPRQARIDAPGALHHIICRGIERRKIFRDDTDRDDFLDRLRTVLLDTATPCFAWTLIPNHFHLLLRTGSTPIATVMRRLLTGYAVSFNHRHHRHGQLFQNRYMSILCDEESYLLELVRYIHLNPLRARLVPNLAALAVYPYSGHAQLCSRTFEDWQDVSSVLSRFDQRDSRASKLYAQFVADGLAAGKRPDLTGGGLVRSLGGWDIAKDRAKRERMKGDERILGTSEFVEKILRSAAEALHRRTRLQASGFGLKQLMLQVTELCGIDEDLILAGGKYPASVRARSLFCYWAVSELGVTATELARRLGLSQPAVSIAVRRGEGLAKEKGWQVNLKGNL